jgi:hypothetical protein
MFPIFKQPGIDAGIEVIVQVLHESATPMPNVTSNHELGAVVTYWVMTGEGLLTDLAITEHFTL